jgi:HK97 family phage prohead protease
MEENIIYRSVETEIHIRSAAQGGDGRTIYGIAVPYGLPQRINDKLTEQFARGAFNHMVDGSANVLLTRGHVGTHEQWPGTIIGKTLMLRDDAAGLYGEWRVSNTAKGDETLELVRDGIFTNLSVGFLEGRSRTLPNGVVERTRADLFEVSVELKGAYGSAAAIAGVRAAGSESKNNLHRAKQILAGMKQLPIIGS